MFLWRGSSSSPVTWCRSRGYAWCTCAARFLTMPFTTRQFLLRILIIDTGAHLEVRHMARDDLVRQRKNLYPESDAFSRVAVGDGPQASSGSWRTVWPCWMPAELALMVQRIEHRHMTACFPAGCPVLTAGAAQAGWRSEPGNRIWSRVRVSPVPMSGVRSSIGHRSGELAGGLRRGESAVRCRGRIRLLAAGPVAGRGGAGRPGPRCGRSLRPAPRWRPPDHQGFPGWRPPRPCVSGLIRAPGAGAG